MKKERYKENKLLPNFIAIGLLLVLTHAAFSWKTKEIIKKRDGNKSVLSGETENLHAAHINHDKNNPQYDNPSNGRLLTVEEHLQDHINRAGRNGLTEEQNNWAISMLQSLLNKK